VTHHRKALLAIAFLGMTPPAWADVITDWNDKAVEFTLKRTMLPPPAERVVALAHAAMFDALNSIERKYTPYLVQLPVEGETSREAAAAAAAGTVLAGINPQAKDEMNATLTSYLAGIPESAAKAAGIKLGTAVGAKILEARQSDGASAPDTYRPRTTPGVYVPTAPTATPQWVSVKPFALTSPSQFRPPAPIALTSPRWATDFNEMKDFGSLTSAKRTPRQTEDGRFWFATDGRVYYPLIRATAEAKKLNLIDCARLYALAAMARHDALSAVFDAKYHYEFWRPVTAIRNGDIDNNAATERDAAWQPLGPTPMHPEYPCAHCIVSASTAGVVMALYGSADVPEFAITSPTAPGVTHRWTNLRTFVDEVSEARIWAGFHWRFSTEVGRDMGYKIGDYVVKNMMQPVTVATR